MFIKKKKIYSIELLFDHTEKINLENLFLIFFSYIKNKENLLKAIYIIVDNEPQIEKNLIWLHNIKIEKIEKMSSIDFETWYDHIYAEDYEYIKRNRYYGFRFVFYKESKAWLDGNIYPIYPWNENLKNIWFKSREYLNEVIKLKKEKEELIKKNIELQKKIIWLRNPRLYNKNIRKKNWKINR